MLATFYIALPACTLLPVQSSALVSISVIAIRIAPRVTAITSAIKGEGHEMPEKNKYYSTNNCSYQVNWRICLGRVIWNTRNDYHLCHNPNPDKCGNCCSNNTKW